MIANLIMYRREELDDAHNAYWALIRKYLLRAGLDAPKQLSQDAEEFAVWNDPGLVLSQTCGMPYRLWLHDKVTLNGTPDYGLEDCPPGYYRSALVTRKSDPRQRLNEFRDAVFAYNQTFSQSGYAAPYWHLQTFGFWFENRVQSGAHLASAQMVAKRDADIASLDAVTWRMINKYEPVADELRVLEWTNPTPGLPYISAAGVDQALVFDAVKSAIDELDEETRGLLGLLGLVSISKKKYQDVPNPKGHIYNDPHSPI